MGIRNDASNRLFFAYCHRRRLPLGREGPLQRDKPKSTIIRYVPIIFLFPQPTTKVADNQIEKYRYLLTLTE